MEDTYVSVELPDEAGEIVVLEVSREEVHHKRMRVPNHKAATCSAPRDYPISTRVIHHVISLVQKRRRACVVQALHGLRWSHHQRIPAPVLRCTRVPQVLFLHWIQVIHNMIKMLMNSATQFG